MKTTKQKYEIKSIIKEFKALKKYYRKNDKEIYKYLKYVRKSDIKGVVEKLLVATDIGENRRIEMKEFHNTGQVNNIYYKDYYYKIKEHFITIETVKSYETYQVGMFKNEIVAILNFILKLDIQEIYRIDEVLSDLKINNYWKETY